MTNENEVLIAINRLETMVAECEQKAAEGTSTVVSPLQNGAGLSEAIVTLRRTIDAIARLQLLVDKRDLQKNLENQKRVDSEES
jgi:hypothetical protein